MPIMGEALSSAKIIMRDNLPLMYKMAIKPPKPDDIDNMSLRLSKTANACPTRTSGSTLRRATTASPTRGAIPITPR